MIGYQLPYTDIELDKILDDINNYQGIIVMWGKDPSTIPTGWKLCDGTNGTPDLRNRFIVGAGKTYNIGDKGGAATVALTISEMPSHTHTGTAAKDSGHTHDVTMASMDTYYAKGGGTTIRSREYQTYTTSSAGTHAHSMSINNTGSNEAHENRPPYYALVYIMKV